MLGKDHDGDVDDTLASLCNLFSNPSCAAYFYELFHFCEFISSQPCFHFFDPVIYKDFHFLSLNFLYSHIVQSVQNEVYGVAFTSYHQRFIIFFYVNNYFYYWTSHYIYPCQYLLLIPWSPVNISKIVFDL